MSKAGAPSEEPVMTTLQRLEPWDHEPTDDPKIGLYARYDDALEFARDGTLRTLKELLSYRAHVYISGYGSREMIDVEYVTDMIAKFEPNEKQ